MRRRRATDGCGIASGLFSGNARALADNDYSPLRPAGRQAQLEQLGALARSPANHLLTDTTLRGNYGYAARARAKRRLLAGVEAEEDQLDERTKFEVMLWYFEKRLGLPVPNDIARHAVDVGFPDTGSFYRALWREWAHVTRGHRPDGGPDERED
jgi:hypothetical protein